MDRIETDERLRAEFAALAGRARLPIPEDRRAALFQGFLGIRRMADLLHAPRPAQVEPLRSPREPE